ncbi:DUF1287 domain-containing protein [Carboxylicivirga sp. A043]|uniref:DUF1287 domain-containing protein n=1 Tax=Carboxylicivirga litoralis TaxID=2816963 RepID=UPI0021CB1D97|nr:DUF1287 domain-containing protein [Carboxylicivirga sp. A043]MCU4155041.1 DUF1287 domain-containing protein [Carboxylicivirga sp. A043]
MNVTRICFTLFVLVVSQQLLSQSSFQLQLADSTLTLTRQKVIYDPSYFSLDYPNGDVPADRGVCTDVVIRAYRKFNIDLQQLVHEDMCDNFELYPKNWGLTSPDKNIDHRRVPNLMVFFSRFGKELTISQNPHDYLPGDIVCWDLGRGLTHIGIVINHKSADGIRYLIVHNIGAGQVVEDCLFSFKMIGHYRFGCDLNR